MKKAYDSVGWQGLSKALTCIKMNRTYIDILKNLHQTRRSFIITTHGLTDAYTIQDGLDQRETHAPILWRIFYDPLLVAVDRLKQSTGYAITRPIRQTSRFATTGATTSSPTENSQEKTYVNHLAFVNDTAWIANSHHSANRILAVANNFFKMNDIQINAQKTEVFVVKGCRLKRSEERRVGKECRSRWSPY